jgi:hypothetical protein
MRAPSSPAGHVGGHATGGGRTQSFLSLVAATERRATPNRRALHDDETGALKMVDQSLRYDPRHDLGGVMLSLPTLAGRSIARGGYCHSPNSGGSYGFMRVGACGSRLCPRNSYPRIQVSRCESPSGGSADAATGAGCLSPQRDCKFEAALAQTATMISLISGRRNQLTAMPRYALSFASSFASA